MDRINAYILDIANRYLDSIGSPRHPAQRPFRKANPTLGEAIAKYTDRVASRPSDPCVVKAYHSLVDQIHRQYKWIESNGIQIMPTESDPYQDSNAMMVDVRDNGRLSVYASETEHDFLSHHDQVAFRAVHDIFGHAMYGYSFGPNGEDNAYRAHRAMFVGPAVYALCAETRCQNCWVNFGPFAHLPPAERPFAAQKAFIPPDEFVWS